LRGWSHGGDDEVFPRGPRAGGAGSLVGGASAFVFRLKIGNAINQQIACRTGTTLGDKAFEFYQAAREVLGAR
jgi:hypothetical protein